MRKDRLIVGLLCIGFAVWTFLADTLAYALVAAIYFVGSYGLPHMARNVAG